MTGTLPLFSAVRKKHVTKRWISPAGDDRRRRDRKGSYHPYGASRASVSADRSNHERTSARSPAGYLRSRATFVASACESRTSLALLCSFGSRLCCRQRVCDLRHIPRYRSRRLPYRSIRSKTLRNAVCVSLAGATIRKAGHESSVHTRPAIETAGNLRRETSEPMMFYGKNMFMAANSAEE